LLRVLSGDSLPPDAFEFLTRSKLKNGKGRKGEKHSNTLEREYKGFDEFDSVVFARLQACNCNASAPSSIRHGAIPAAAKLERGAEGDGRAGGGDGGGWQGGCVENSKSPPPRAACPPPARHSLVSAPRAHGEAAQDAAESSGLVRDAVRIQRETSGCGDPQRRKLPCLRSSH
jgi:hypothetical protein